MEVSIKSEFKGLLDEDIQDKITKALTTATGGGALFDNMRDREIADELDKRHILWANLRKRPGEGAAALLTRKEDRAGGANYVSETGQAVSNDATYGTEEFDYKVLSSVGEVGTKLVLAGRAVFGDLEAQLLMDINDDAIDKAEQQLVVGSGTGNFPLGLNTAVDGFDSGSQKVILGVGNGSQIDLTKIDEAADLSRTRGAIIGMAVTSDRVRRELNAELQAFQRITEKVPVKGGFRVIEYDNYPVLDSSKVLNETVGSSTNAHRMSFIDGETGYWIQELLAMTPFQLARTKASAKTMESLGIHAFVHKNRRRVSQLAAIIP